MKIRLVRLVPMEKLVEVKPKKYRLVKVKSKKTKRVKVKFVRLILL